MLLCSPFPIYIYQALAYHGNALGIPVTVVMPVNAPLTKISRSKGFGATVITHGAHIGQCKEYALEEFPNLEYINGKPFSLPLSHVLLTSASFPRMRYGLVVFSLSLSLSLVALSLSLSHLYISQPQSQTLNLSANQEDDQLHNP